MIFTLGLVLFLSIPSFAKKMELSFPPLCTLNAALDHMGFNFDPQKPLPKIVRESEMDLSDFQDLIEKKWQVRPKGFLNIYMPESNTIFLVDNQEYYRRNGRFVDDSLAHEYTHYIQVVYQQTKLDGSSDHLEEKAIQLQNWYRSSFLNTGKSPCF